MSLLVAVLHRFRAVVVSESPHEWLGSNWGILFSHPKDFTPVCTTELGRAANLRQEFEKRGVKMLAVSVDDVDSHKRWLADIEDTQSCKLEYPILADSDRSRQVYDRFTPSERHATVVRVLIDPNENSRNHQYQASTAATQESYGDRIAKAHGNYT